MQFKVLLSLLFLIFSISSSLAQTCTSSGGDDDTDLDIEPYQFRCGHSMMYDRMKKASSDFKKIENCDNYWADGTYFINKGKIYYSSEYGIHELVVGAEAKSFRCEDGTARDNNDIYFKGKAISDIDKASFKSIGLAYCSDNKTVFYRNRYNKFDKLLKIEEAAATSFELIGELESNYAKDSYSVYYAGKVVVSSDPESFEVLEYGYARDKNFVYYSGVKVEGMNGANFKVLKDCFLGSDGIVLCNGGKVLENSDAKSFRAIECGYYKDNNNVYLNGAILKEIDSKSFQILTWGYTKDKNGVYCDLKLIDGADPTSFKVLGRKHSKDNNGIFYMNQIIDCDYKSFEVNNKVDYLSKDINHTYKKGIRIN